MCMRRLVAARELNVVLFCAPNNLLLCTYRSLIPALKAVFLSLQVHITATGKLRIKFTHKRHTGPSLHFRVLGTINKTGEVARIPVLKPSYLFDKSYRVAKFITHLLQQIEYRTLICAANRN